LHRGGNGINMVYQFLEPGVIAIHDDRWFTRPWGVNGGNPGGRARKVLERADGEKITVGNKREDIAVAAGDKLHFITWGGGGWGDPLMRDAALVAEEVAQGLVTESGARSYGVVLVDGEVDAAATEALRCEMRSHHKETGLFNRGGSIDELRETCLAETGLPPPLQPVWALAAE
jgi:N-methylhydantoinase B